MSNYFKDFIAVRTAQNALYNQMLDNRAMMNGFIGTLENVFDYCNEKNEGKGKFILKCTPHCKHNAPH